MSLRRYPRSVPKKKKEPSRSKAHQPHQSNRIKYSNISQYPYARTIFVDPKYTSFETGLHLGRQAHYPRSTPFWTSNIPRPQASTRPQSCPLLLFQFGQKLEKGIGPPVMFLCLWFKLLVSFDVMSFGVCSFFLRKRDGSIIIGESV